MKKTTIAISILTALSGIAVASAQPGKGECGGGERGAEPRRIKLERRKLRSHPSVEPRSRLRPPSAELARGPGIIATRLFQRRFKLGDAAAILFLGTQHVRVDVQMLHIAGDAPRARGDGGVAREAEDGEVAFARRLGVARGIVSGPAV